MVAQNTKFEEESMNDRSNTTSSIKRLEVYIEQIAQ